MFLKIKTSYLSNFSKTEGTGSLDFHLKMNVTVLIT